MESMTWRDTMHEHPKIPWWVHWWTVPTTTRSSLRADARFFFFLAVVPLAIAAILHFWSPGTGRYVLPWAFLFPVACVAAGIWQLAAASWIDRHDTWDRVGTPEERSAYAENHGLYQRSLPLGLLLAAIGGAAGALVGWRWETDIGIVAGLACGTIGGFVVGLSLAGFKEGVQSGTAKPAHIEARDAEGSAGKVKSEKHIR
jgi:hypothetical protein